MGILVNKSESMSELQKRINADLRAKIAAASDGGAAPKTDFSYDTAYTENLRPKSTFPFMRAVVFFTTALLIAILFFVI